VNSKVQANERLAGNSPAIPEDEQRLSRYVVGIDLGTTNSALCYVDTDASNWRVETFRITQWVDFGQHEPRETLPSFHYELTRDEASACEGKLPWESKPSTGCVGVFARDAGLRHPGRRIASAKSWLSHDGVDRSADFLPWHGDFDVSRMSPVEASSKYLAHLRTAWDHEHPQYPLDQQDVVITLPASFDEVARELTVMAAKRAGLARVYLIEEPQAAFYSWIDTQAGVWQERISAGQMILVCDIGGGTSDFTLIRVQPAGEDSSQVQFHRVAVGKHLILGGDNLDLALARLAETKLLQQTGAESLSADQWDRLIQVARLAKETMLSANRPESYTLSLPSQGSRLIGGAIQIALSADEIDAVLVDGFFPEVALTDRPTSGDSGFREFGLPYAADPAVTRHLAAFLRDHRRSGLAEGDITSEVRPSWLLFNGGVMSAPSLRNRITESLARWFSIDEDGAKSPSTRWAPEVLENKRLDLAVARGAAYYAMVRRGQGVKIAANLGRSYYMQVAESSVEGEPVKAICLIPGIAEAGQRFEIADHPLELQLGEPVQFPLWASSTRLADRAGEIVQIAANEASRLPPIYTALGEGKRRETKTIRVVIQSELSEIGTVGMWCVDADSGRRWQLEFDIRSTLETDREAHIASGESAGIVDDDTIRRCEAAIHRVFGSEPNLTPNKLNAELQEITELKRESWPPSLLRKMWQALMDAQAGRRQSPQHEARWLNLLGYCLRPGYGVAVDDWRVSQTWKTVFGKLAFAASQSRTESLVLWRRIAGGMTSGQQQQLALPLLSSLGEKGSRMENAELAECWRLAASLERIAIQDKIQLGRAGLAEFERKKSEPIRPALLWAIGRIGSRQPVYGPLNTVVPRDEVERWLGQLRSWRMLATELGSTQKALLLAIVQLARLTGDRHRDVSDETRAMSVRHFESLDAPSHFKTLLSEGGRLSSEEESAVFGESLPLGIRLAR
jgi:DNA-K related protein/Hsp70 protein